VLRERERERRDVLILRGMHNTRCGAVCDAVKVLTVRACDGVNKRCVELCCGRAGGVKFIRDQKAAAQWRMTWWHGGHWSLAQAACKRNRIVVL